jgi:protein SCO1
LCELFSVFLGDACGLASRYPRSIARIDRSKWATFVKWDRGAPGPEHPMLQALFHRPAAASGRRLAGLAIALFAMGFGAAASAQLYSRFGAVPWVDADGRNRTLDDCRGRPVVMTMSYTACRKTCSTSMLVLQQMQRMLARRGRDVAVVVVSYDPTHDSPAQWRRYRDARRLPDSWHFLSGTEADTHRLADFLELKYWVYDEHVMHDFRIVVFDADGKRERDILIDRVPDLERELAGL